MTATGRVKSQLPRRCGPPLGWLGNRAAESLEATLLCKRSRLERGQYQKRLQLQCAQVTRDVPAVCVFGCSLVLTGAARLADGIFLRSGGSLSSMKERVCSMKLAAACLALCIWRFAATQRTAERTPSEVPRSGWPVGNVSVRVSCSPPPGHPCQARATLLSG